MPRFVTLGMFIIDQFSFLDEEGLPTGRHLDPQIGGGGTYTSIGARIWLPVEQVGMIVDRGKDFPETILNKLESFGLDMWHFRDHADRETTRALNSYRGDQRSFEYLTPRIRITPRDLVDTPLARPDTIHFICSPLRAKFIVSELQELGWSPITIYEPIPDRCVPEELPALTEVLPSICVLSPNAEEALSLLSMSSPVTKVVVEQAAAIFLELGIGPDGQGSVVIRSGSLGAYVATREKGGKWVDAFWTGQSNKVVDVTGAGNSFLGGIAAGLLKGDIYEATFYASVSASFIIEQEGLPTFSHTAKEDEKSVGWNGDDPKWRLEELRTRHENK